MNHQPHDDFAQLRNIFSDPITPAPSFAAELKERVMQEAAKSISSLDSRPFGTVRGSISKAQVIRMPGFTNTGWQGTLVTAATILLVLALAFSGLRSVIQRDGGGGTNRTSQFGIPAASPGTAESDTGTIEPTPELATISARDPETDPLSAGWGGADRSWNTGTASPQLSVEISELETNVNGPGNVGQAQIFGDVLVRAIVRADLDSSGVEAIDMTTGKLLWFQKIDFRGGLASDGDRLFIWQTREPHIGLTALDLHTGEQLWNLTNGFSVENLVYSQSPVVNDGVVYFTDGESNVGAADAVTGELIWRSNSAYWMPPSGPLPVIPEEMTPFVQPNFAVDATHVYAIRANRIIEALDRATGESLWTQDLTNLRANVDTSGRKNSNDTPEVTIIVTSSGLIVAQSIDGERDDPGITWLASLDATTGSINWQIFGNALTGNLATIDTTLFAPISNGTVQTYDLETGAATTVIDPDPASSTQIRLLATTNAIFVMKAGATGYTIEMFDTGNLDQPAQTWTITDDAASEATPMPVPQFSGNTLIVSTKSAQIYSIAPESTGVPEPATSVLATPTVTTDSLSGGWGGADRSFSVATPLADLSPELELTRLDQPGDDGDFLTGTTVHGSISHSQIFDDILIRQIELVNDSGGLLQAIDLLTMQQSWAVPIGTTGGFATNGEDLFVTQTWPTEKRGLVALSLETGETHWWQAVDSFNLQNLEGGQGPVYVDGLVYLSTGNQVLAAFKADSGTFVWDHQYPRQPVGQTLPPVATPVPPFNVTSMGPPVFAVDDHAIYTIWANLEIDARNPTTGEQLWFRRFGANQDHGVGTPSILVQNGIVITAITHPDDSGDPAEILLTAYGESLGDKRWQKVIDDELNGNLAIAGGNPVVPLRLAGIQTINLETGKLIGTFQPVPAADDLVTISGAGASYVVARNTSFGQRIITRISSDGATILGGWIYAADDNAPIPAVSVWHGGLIIPAPDGAIWSIGTRP